METNYEKTILLASYFACYDRDVSSSNTKLTGARWKYLRVLEQVIALGTEDKVSKQIMESGLFPRGKLENLLVDNYSDKEVLAILKSAKIAYGEGSKRAEAMDKMLSGELKSQLDVRRAKAFPKEAAPPPPVKLDNGD